MERPYCVSISMTERHYLMIVFSSELPADEVGLSSFKERGNTSFAILVEFHDSAYVSFEGVE